MGNSSSRRSLPDGTHSPLTQLINQHIYAKDQLFKMSSGWHEWTKGDLENRWPLEPTCNIQTSAPTLEAQAQQPDAIPIPRINLNNGETNDPNNLHTGVIAGHTKVDVEEDEVHHHVDLPPATTVVKRAITGTSATNNLRTSIPAGHSEGEAEEDKNHGKDNHHVDPSPNTAVTEGAPLQKPMPKQIALPGD
ncbi:unnamed protein product [Boreogadus saida]